MIYLEFQEGVSSKFWQIEVSGNSFTVTYGKIGTAGKSQQKSFDTPEEAQKEADKLVAHKRKKGYYDADQTTSPEDVAEINKRKAQCELLVEKIEQFVNDSSLSVNSYYRNALQTTMEDIESELELYNLTIQYPALRSAVLKVFDALMEASENYNHLWLDDMTQAGGNLAECFAMAEQSCVPLLTRFISACDIDHGVDINKQVINVWNQWGFCQETSDLIVTFMFRDQNGYCFPDSLDEQETGIIALMEDKKSANMVLESIYKWLKNDAQHRELYHTDGELEDGEFIFVYTELFAALLKTDTVEAEESLRAFCNLYMDEKIPKIHQIYTKSAPLPKGSEEQMFSFVMDAMDDFGQRVYERSRESGLQLNIDSKIGVAKPDPTRMSLVRIEGEKYNKLQHYVNGDVGENFVEKKADVDYSDIPDSFFMEKLLPALVKWLENKIDTQAYMNLYSGQVKFVFSVFYSSTARVEIEIDRREVLQEWINYFIPAVQNREFTSWGCKELGADVNLWLIFALVDQLGADVIVEFLSMVNNHIKQEHHDGKPCVQTDIFSYIEAYYETLQKEDISKQQAQDFLLILAEANTFYKLSKGKNLPFHKEAKLFAQEVISQEG